MSTPGLEKIWIDPIRRCRMILGAVFITPVLLVLVLSWLPSAIALALLLLTIALLFVLPLQKGLPLRAEDV